IQVPLDFEVDAAGNLYYLSMGFPGQPSKVFEVSYVGLQAPSSATVPDVRVATGQAATFTTSVNGTGPFTYQWQRFQSGVWSDIAGATSASLTLPGTSTTDNGAQFRVVVANGAGSVVSSVATLTVVPDQLPVAVIDGPAAGTIYRAGDIIT